MDTATDTREEAFRRSVARAFNALRPRAVAALEGLLQANELGFAASSNPVARHLTDRVEIRNIGRLAGQVRRDGTIVVNSQLVDFPDAVRPTVAHELAHAVVEAARRGLLERVRRPGDGPACVGIARRRGDWAAHGRVWRSVAQQLGDCGERCHRLPLKPLRRLRRFLYRADCGAEVVLTSVRHNRLQRDRRLEYRWTDRDIRISGRHFVQEVETADRGD